MTIAITNDVRIRRERKPQRGDIYEFWLVEVYDFGYGWRESGRYESQNQAELAARYFANQG